MGYDILKIDFSIQSNSFTKEFRKEIKILKYGLRIFSCLVNGF